MVLLGQFAGCHEVFLGFADALLLELGQGGELVGCQGRQELLDLLEPLVYGVPVLPLAFGQHELVVQGLAGLVGQFVGLVFRAGQPADRFGALACQQADDVALVEGVLGVTGQEQAHVRGDVGGVLVLLAGQAAGRAPAVVQREAGAGQGAVQAGDLGALLLELLLGRVVGLRRLLGLEVETLKVCQETCRGLLLRVGGGLGRRRRGCGRGCRREDRRGRRCRRHRRRAGTMQQPSPS